MLMLDVRQLPMRDGTPSQGATLLDEPRLSNPLAKIWSVLFVLWGVWRLTLPLGAIYTVVSTPSPIASWPTFLLWLSLALIVDAGLITAGVFIWLGSPFTEKLLKVLFVVALLGVALTFLQSGAGAGMVELFMMLFMFLPPLLVETQRRSH